MMQPQRRESVLEAIRDIIFKQLRVAHAAGFFHQDLHWRNLLLTGHDEDSFRVAWIDCPRARYQTLRRDHAVLVDLSTLSRIAPRYLSARQRFASLSRFLGDQRPYALTRRWFRRIERHHPPG